MLLGKETLQNGTSSSTVGWLGRWLVSPVQDNPTFPQTGHKYVSLTNSCCLSTAPQCKIFNKETRHQGADGPEMWDSHPVNWKSPDLNRYEMRVCLNNQIIKVRTPRMSRSLIHACLFAFFNREAGDVRTAMHQTGSCLIHSLKITTPNKLTWPAASSTHSLLMTTSGRYVITMPLVCSQDWCRVKNNT